MKKFETQFVFLAIFLAFCTAFSKSFFPHFFSENFFLSLELVSTLFLRLLRLLVVPLVGASIISSIANLGKERSFKKMGLKTLFVYLGTTVAALLIGLFLVNLIQPGSGYDNKLLESYTKNSSALSMKKSSLDLKGFLLETIPENIFSTLAEGNMLGLIFFSILFGIALSKVEEKHQKTLISFFESVFQTILQISSMVLRILPIGVYALTTKAFCQTGKAAIQPLMLFSLTVILGLALFMFVLIPIILRLYAKISPLEYIRSMSPALITAFTTSSSSASIPITIECVEKRVGVSARIAKLIVPLGISINLSGSALYECVAALFAAQAYGLELSFITQFSVMFLALFTSLGVAGIPAGSLVATIIIMQSIGLPPEAVGLFIAVERFMDMARTSANIYGDGACAVLIAASEGETGFIQKKTEKKPLFSR